MIVLVAEPCPVPFIKKELGMCQVETTALTVEQQKKLYNLIAVRLNLPLRVVYAGLSQEGARQV